MAAKSSERADFPAILCFRTVRCNLPPAVFAALKPATDARFWDRSACCCGGFFVFIGCAQSTLPLSIGSPSPRRCHSRSLKFCAGRTYRSKTVNFTVAELQYRSAHGRINNVLPRSRRQIRAFCVKPLPTPCTRHIGGIKGRRPGRPQELHHRPAARRFTPDGTAFPSCRIFRSALPWKGGSDKPESSHGSLMAPWRA